MDLSDGRLPRTVYRAAQRVDNLSLRLLDLGVVTASWILALVAGYEANVSAGSTGHLVWIVAVAVVIQVIAHRLAGLYGPVWRYASVEEACRVVIGVFVGALVATACIAGLARLSDTHLPLYTAPPVAALLMLLGCGGIRFQSRLFALERQRSRDPDDSRALIVGAGSEGVTLAYELSHTDAGRNVRVVGFIDDDPWLLGRSVRGLRVLGPTAELDGLCRSHEIDRILIAQPEAGRERIKAIVDQALLTDAQVKVLPSSSERVHGPLLRNVRDLDLTDLLGREHAPVDSLEIGEYLGGATVLITGAGGSIGSEIARQVVRYNPGRILLLDRDESLLHDVVSGSLAGAEPMLVDVRDRGRVSDLFERHRPDVVFHAAAHKHVPMLEQFPSEAVRTNVLGTWWLAKTAADHGCERFVHISTDKAADPCSVMGATKRAAEQIVFEIGRRYRLPFVAVRFGNVLGSRGSVVPTFLRQILDGGPVTVTSPEMTRYFMTIPEAVSLVLQSGAMADDSRIFLLDMGEPVSILALARQMIRLAGLRPDEDIAVTVTGMRPGERLHERLHDDAETIEPAGHPSIAALTPKTTWEWDDLTDVVASLGECAEAGADHSVTYLLEDMLRRGGVDCQLGHDSSLGASPDRRVDAHRVDAPDPIDLTAAGHLGASRRPAVLGGDPCFAAPLAFSRPTTPDLDAVVQRLRPSYDRGMLTNDALVRELEERVATRLDVAHVVAVSSCTAGLMLSVQALVDGRPGPVVLPSFTFSASAHAVAWNGRTPLFVDIDPATFQVDGGSLAAALEGASAVMATHVFGAPCDPRHVETVAHSAGIPVMFDAAHALGASCDGDAVGAFGEVEVFSLTPTKVLVAGEGGLIATNDASLAERLRIGRNYGNPGNYDTRFAGLNARMSEFHAAVALESLEILDSTLLRRRQIAFRYRRGLDDLPGIRYQEMRLADSSTFKDFTVTVDASQFGLSRDELVQVLATEGIDTRNYFDPPVHRQRSYRHVPTPELLTTDLVSASVVSLPIYPHLGDDDIDKIVEVISVAHHRADELSAELRSSNRAGPLRPWLSQARAG